MNNLIIAGNKPFKLELKKGQDYYFYTCGQYKNQSFCDDFHQCNSSAPKTFVAEE